MEGGFGGAHLAVRQATLAGETQRRVVIREGYRPLEGVGALDLAILLEDEDQLARGARKPTVEGGGEPAVRDVEDGPHAGVGLRSRLEGGPYGLGARVIHGDDFEVAIGLAARGAKRGFEEAPGVVNRDDDGDPRSHRACPFP